MARPKSKEQRAKRAQRQAQRQSQRQLGQSRLLESINMNSITTDAQKRKVLAGRHEEFLRNRTTHGKRLANETYETTTKKGALAKQYYDYVEKGWIKQTSFMDVYDAIEFMEQNVSQADMERAIQQADEWRTRTFNREMQRRADRAANRPIIPF